jgi:hypothetical protein
LDLIGLMLQQVLLVTQLGALWRLTFATYNYNDQLKEDKMDRACSMHRKKQNTKF